MWSKIILCVLVSVAFASNTPAWKSNTKYVYEVRGRTLASLHEISNQYSGIILKAQISLQAKSNGILSAEISDAKYAQLQTELPEGWNSYIRDEELVFKDLQMTNKPFQIIINNGVIHDLIVDKTVTNWEANIIKSIVSQFQLDTKAENLMASEMNTLPEDDLTSAVFKTMEDTVTGTTETLYDIHLLPKHVLAEQPWLVPQMNPDEQVIEIVKNKNYSQCQERPSYYYGLSGIGKWEPASNQMGQFFSRNSVSRAVIIGKLDRYTVQNSYTINSIVLSPSLNNKQKGSVMSMLNVTLQEVQQETVEPMEISNPVSLGNLVYRFNSPSSSNMVRQRQQYKPMEEPNSSEEKPGRYPRNIDQNIRNHQQELQGNPNDYYWQPQEEPQMSSEPESPLLPFTIGYKGNSIKKDPSYKLVENVQKLSEEIGQNIKDIGERPAKDVLGKFTILGALTRIMNFEELQQASKHLYSEKHQDSWVVFRDVVAESGTGPAFLTIQDWILTQKIKGEEAAVILSTMAHAVRQPTEEYMRGFFNLIKKPEVQAQVMLKETAFMAYTTLVRRVYVNKRESHNQYPVHSFGKFQTQRGKSFLEKTLIPYLSKLMHDAISNRNNTNEIHVYIRALGNVGHKHILAAFEPYLEGQKKCTEFQRLWMVVCMDKLVKTNPLVARSILFKIYQNIGEAQEVRVAAVYQLMRTSPPTDMLQLMADATNRDTSEYVNAAVKSSIESTANLEGEEFQFMRSSARAAKPLLNNKEYGIQFSQNYLKTFINNEMNIFFKQTVQSVGSDDSILPKGLKYAMRSNLGGFRHQIVNLQGMVSSIEDLTEAMVQQTKWYKNAEEQHEHQHASNMKNKFSSENIAKLLGMKFEQNEQLEGVLNMEFGSLHKMLSFDAQTMEQMPEVVRAMEEKLRKGHSFQFNKWVNREEIALSFPTEMGLPFLFTYDVPSYMSVEGKAHLETHPEISNGKHIEMPEKLIAKIELHAVLLGKVQSRLTFITPFDHQQYSSGYDQVVQFQLPITGKVFLEMKKNLMVTEIEPIEQLAHNPIFHLSTWPYTSRSDIMCLKPVSLRKETKQIQQVDQYSFDKVFGNKETGMAFHLQMKQEQPFSFDLLTIFKNWHDKNLLSNVFARLHGYHIQHKIINLYYDKNESAAKKVTVKMSCQKDYKSEASEPHHIAKYFKGLSTHMQEDSHFHNVLIRAFDASVQFHGKHNVEYLIRGAVGKSNIDPKSLMLLEYSKKSNNPDIKPFHMSLHANNYIPNTNEINLMDSLKSEPTMKSRVHIVFGSHDASTKLNAEIDVHRSNDRKEFLKKHPLFQLCEQEMKQGNYMGSLCETLSVNANLLDRVTVELNYENIKPETMKMLQSMCEAVRMVYYPHVELKKAQELSKHQVKFEARFNPDLKSVNMSVRVEDQQTEIRNIEVDDWSRRMFVVHPVYHVRDRLASKALGLQTYKRSCVVDGTEAHTFNNKSYSMEGLGQHWTVMLQNVPKVFGKQLESYAVLLKRNQVKQTEVKIVLTVPATDGKTVEIDLTPASVSPNGYSGSKPSAKVMINGQLVQIKDKESHDIKHGFVQMYSLSNGEVKIEFLRAFTLIYDGKHVKILMENNKFRNALRGLCGQYNEDPTSDFLTSQNCVASSSSDFIQSYTLEESKKQPSGPCYRKMTKLANVVSNLEAGRRMDHQTQVQNHSGMCLRYQTRYIVENEQICFTTEALPVCQCTQNGVVSQDVPVHCVKLNNVSELWKKQIDMGASPDFSHKVNTHTIQMEVPKGCSK